MKKIASITTLSFIMTCIIVFYHCSVSTQPISILDEKINNYITLFIGQFSIIAMNYFFCITAFLLFRNLTINNYGKKIKKRVFSLLIPYFLWQFLFSIVMILTDLFIKKKSVSLIEYVKTIFLFEKFPPDGPLWYLYSVFFLAVLSPVFLFLFKNKRIGFIVLVIALFAVYGLTHCDSVSFTHYGFIGSTFSYLYSYILGVFYGMHYQELDDYSGLKYVAALVIIGFVFSFGYFEEFGLKLVLSTIPILLLYFFPKNLSEPRKIYRISFIVFAIHQPLFGIYSYFITMIFNKVGIPSCIANISYRIIGLIISLVVASIMYSLLKKTFPRLLKILTGGRS